MTIPMETLRELERLRARVEELEYELECLNSTADTEVMALMDRFNLTVSEARVVRAMAHSGGAPMSRAVLAEVANEDIDNLRTVDSHIKRIRGKNRAELPIDSIYGLGYRLLPETAQMCRDVMAGRIKPERYRSHLYMTEAAA